MSDTPTAEARRARAQAMAAAGVIAMAEYRKDEVVARERMAAQRAARLAAEPAAPPAPRGRGRRKAG